MHRRNYLIFNRPIYGGSATEECLILSEPFFPERFLLGCPHLWGVIYWVVGGYKHVGRLRQVFLHVHSEHGMAITS